MTRVSIGALLSPGGDCATHYPTAIEFDSFDVGEEQPRQSVKHVLWMLNHRGQKLALLWTSETTHAGCAQQLLLECISQGKQRSRGSRRFL